MTDEENLEYAREHLDHDPNDEFGDGTTRATLRALVRLLDTARDERDLLMKEPNNRLDGYRELGATCAALANENARLEGVMYRAAAELRHAYKAVDLGRKIDPRLVARAIVILETK